MVSIRVWIFWTCLSSWKDMQFVALLAFVVITHVGEEDRCLHVALSVVAFLEKLTKSVTSRATTAIRAGCVQRGLGHYTPFSGRSSTNAAEDDPRPNILQLNTEGLTANKISVIEQPTYKNKASIIVLQETHCTTADKQVIPNFSLAGSVLSRKHGLDAFATSGWNGHWLISLQNNQKLSGCA